MASTKARYHHGDLRNALIDQAVRLVEEGAGEFSLREVARRVGVSANATYRHFSDRAGLLKAVAEVGFQRMEGRMRRGLASVGDRPRGKAAVERVKALGRDYVGFAVEHPELLKVMFGVDGLPSLEGRGPPPPTPVAMLEQGLDALVEEGVLPRERRAGADLKAWVIVHGFASLVVQGVAELQDARRRDEALESLLDFALAGLSGGSARPPWRASRRGRRR